jgi:glycosyltransferase involved in cell wall biosynthesis
LSRPSNPAIVISANSAWNIHNFRLPLIRALAERGWRVVIAVPDADRLAGLDAELVDLPLDRSGMNPLADLRLLLAYVRLFRRVRPAWFLGFTMKPNIHGLLAARVTGIRAVPTISGLGTAFIGGTLLSRLVVFLCGIAFRPSPAVLFHNRDDRRLFLRRRIVRPRQARLVPGSGVDLDRFKPEPPASSTGPARFLFVGRLIGDKGIREFVEAARLLRGRLPRCRLQVAGPLDPGNRSAICRAELDGWIAEGLVDYLGALDDVRPQVAAATAVVLPSYREGMPRSLLEAAAMGRPMIAADVPGNRQLVEHGVNGLLCVARDPASLADAIERVASMDQEKRAAMGASARARVERDFDQRIVIEAYLRLIWPIVTATK